MQSVLRPIVKSQSTPNLRTSTGNARRLVTECPSPEDPSSTVAAIASPSALQRRAISLQNLPADAAVAANAHSSSSSLADAAIVAKKSFFVTATSTIVSKFPSLFLEPQMAHDGIASSMASMEQATEDNPVTNVVQDNKEVSGKLHISPLTDAEPENENAVLMTQDKSKDALGTENTQQRSSPMSTEWFSEPSIPDDDIVIIASPKSPKRVSFSPIAAVILIPTKEEYHSAGLSENLWWRSWEMREFKYNAYREVQNIMEIYGISQVKEAFRRISMLCDHDAGVSQYGTAANSHVNIAT